MTKNNNTKYVHFTNDVNGMGLFRCEDEYNRYNR